MAITVSRLNKPTRAQLNQGRQKADAIPYFVQGIVFNQLKSLVLGGIGVTGLPRIGDQHPDFGSLTARSISVDPVDNGTGLEAEVTVEYATSNFPGAGLLHAAIDVSGGQFVLSSSYVDVDVAIPVAKLKTYTASVDGVEKSLTAWAVEEQTVTETRTVLRARWGIQGAPLTVAQMQIFGEESNHLHTLGGTKYLFRAGSVMAKDNLTYEVNASWELDTGTPTQNSDDATAYKLPGDMYYRDGGAGPGLMRDPYKKLISTPAILPDAPPDDVASWPLIAQVRYAVDGDHTRLPGVPNL